MPRPTSSRHTLKLAIATSALSALVLLTAFAQSAFSAYTSRWGVFDPVSDGTAYITTGVDDTAAQVQQDPAMLSVDDYDRAETTMVNASGVRVCDDRPWAGYVLMYQDKCGYKATVFRSDPKGIVHSSTNLVYSPGHMGSAEFVARVRGTACNGAPRIVATITDGSGERTVLDATVNSSTYYTTMRTFSTQPFYGERQRVKLQLANPYKTSSCERTLWVDFAGFRPRTRNTVTPAGGGTVVTDSAAMNGSRTASVIDSGTTTTPVTSSTNVYVGWMQYQNVAVRVRSGGSCGGQSPRMRVAFRGWNYIDTTVANTTYAASYDGLLVGDMTAANWSGAVNSTVAITLANPYRSSTCSRKLYVDYVSVVPHQSTLESWARGGTVTRG